MTILYYTNTPIQTISILRKSAFTQGTIVLCDTMGASRVPGCFEGPLMHFVSSFCEELCKEKDAEKVVSGWKERVADPTVAQFLCGGMHLFSIKQMRRGLSG